MMRTFWLAALTVVLLTACGTATTTTSTPTTSPGAKDAKDDPSRAAAEKDPADTAATPAPDSKSAEAAHKEFVTACAKTDELKPYCECGWETFAKELTPAEMNSDNPPQEKLEHVKLHTQQTCISKMPESMIKDGFLKGCTRDSPGFKDYCECFYPELRKQFSALEIGDKATLKSPKFTEATRAIGKKCGPKLPEAEVKKSFLQGCADRDAKAGKFCECAWKQLRSSISYVDLANVHTAETEEFKKATERLHKSCDSLKPAK